MEKNICEQCYECKYLNSDEDCSCAGDDKPCFEFIPSYKYREKYEESNNE
jgi:hypothetical protein